MGCSADRSKSGWRKCSRRPRSRASTFPFAAAARSLERPSQSRRKNPLIRRSGYLGRHTHPRLHRRPRDRRLRRRRCACRKGQHPSHQHGNQNREESTTNYAQHIDPPDWFTTTHLQQQWAEQIVRSVADGSLYPCNSQPQLSATFHLKGFRSGGKQATQHPFVLSASYGRTINVDQIT